MSCTSWLMGSVFVDLMEGSDLCEEEIMEDAYKGY